jgi:arylsulfatase A-like enzyme
MIVVDALRPRDISLYGYDKEVDKNIKKIASESIVFENNFSASNASYVSLTSIFSGQYPTTNGFIHQMPHIEKEEIDKLRKNKFWLPIYLKNQGYATISTTPQHMWFKKGFDFYPERKSQGKGSYLEIPIIKKILLGLPNWIYCLGKKVVKSRASPPFHSAKEVMDLSISKIKDLDKPFFLFMHFLDTHCPYPGVKVKRVKGDKTIKKILSEIKSSSHKEYVKKRFYDCKANSFEQIKQKLDDSIVAVDKQIGRLAFFLKSQKLWKNTIFIILADHGDSFGEHKNYFCRGGLYDDCIHVPLIMCFPDIRPKRISELTSSIDITPSILDVLGEKQKKMDGKSLIPLIKKGKQIHDKVLAVDSFCKNRVATRTKFKKSIITKEGKCYLCGDVHGKNEEKYDLQKDPEELKNVLE